MKPSFETIKAVNAVLALTKDELEEFAYRVHHVSPSKALRIEVLLNAADREAMLEEACNQAIPRHEEFV